MDQKNPHPSFADRDDEMRLMREIMRTHQMMLNAFSREIGVPPSQATLLKLIALSGSGIGVMELAAELGINAAGVTRQVQLLEAEGLLSRRADPRDARRNYVSLSAKGEQILRELHERSHEMQRHLIEAIGAKEMAIATDVLVKLQKFVTGYLNERHKRAAVR